MAMKLTEKRNSLTAMGSIASRTATILEDPSRRAIALIKAVETRIATKVIIFFCHGSATPNRGLYS